jgi:hypothetical protein
MKSRTAPTAIRMKDTGQPYSAKIIKAGALLSDTKTMLASWQPNLSVTNNLEKLKNDNVFGKASRKRVSDMLAIFRQRFLSDETTIRSLMRLAKGNASSESLDRILYFLAAQSDQLLHDTVTEMLYEFVRLGKGDVRTIDVQSRLLDWVAEGKMSGQWSADTAARVAQGLLATLRDFGILKGVVKKHLTYVHLPVEAFAYIAFWLRRNQPSGTMLLNHHEWRLFFLSNGAVENLFLQAHQSELLEYHAAGSIIRIDFPTTSLEEYAGVIAQRMH